jgi:hypothetical protein
VNDSSCFCILIASVEDCFRNIFLLFDKHVSCYFLTDTVDGISSDEIRDVKKLYDNIIEQFFPGKNTSPMRLRIV